MTVKIAFFELKELDGWEVALLKKGFEGSSEIEFFFFNEPINEGHIDQIKEIQILSVFIYSKVNKSIIHSLSNLKFISTRSTGYDHIDLETCEAKNILISNVPYYGENTIAEHTFALILALSRNVHKSYVRTQRNDFSIEGLKGFDLKGKTLGIIGTGRIGLHVARIARGFGMKVLAFDIKQDDFLADIINYTYTSFEDVLRNSDIVSLHVPYNNHTHHLINRENILLFKKGSILINTARGGVVETEALLKGLNEKILRGIGLDVIEGEEYIKEEKQLLYDPDKMDVLSKIVKDQILLKSDNVVFTPHIAFYSQEALERIFQTTIENIQGFLRDSLQFLVNKL